MIKIKKLLRTPKKKYVAVVHHAREESRVGGYLLLVSGNPVCGDEPLVALDVVDAVFEVAVPLCQVDLQQVSQQVLQVPTEVGRKAHL